jgi:transcription initiation factor IIF auxiliary subunit
VQTDENVRIANEKWENACALAEQARKLSEAAAKEKENCLTKKMQLVQDKAK